VRGLVAAVALDKNCAVEARQQTEQRPSVDLALRDEYNGRECDQNRYVEPGDVICGDQQAR
jgi:hypothetical protein